jgi:DNA-binding GntR family transcriptional regulator
MTIEEGTVADQRRHSVSVDDVAVGEARRVLVVREVVEETGVLLSVERLTEACRTMTRSVLAVTHR